MKTLFSPCFVTRFSAMCATVALLASLALGQEVTATLTGVVTDPSGAAVSGANVVATNLDTTISSSTNTGSSGGYVITLLRPGRYKITVSQPGFKTFEQTGINLEVNQRARVDVPLSVGQLTDRIEISGEPPIIETEDSAVGKVIDNQSITQLPLNGRVNIMGLMALAPGIQNAGAQDQVPYYGITPQVAGGSTTGSVAFTLDGITNQLTWIERGLVEYPPLDGLQEFKVITSGASAEFGKANQVVVVSKSGNNELHGELYEYNRNREFTAKNFFAESLPNPAYNRNEYGGNFGGPIVIPHVYNGRNRSFFFMNYEGFNLVQASTVSQAVPTVAERAGNFAGLPAITDPYTGAPFPGNVIPSTRINPVDVRLGQLYPLPNTAGTGAAGTGVNLVQNIGYQSGVQRGSFRIDHHISDQTQLAFSYLQENVGPNPSIGPVSTFGGLAGIGEHLILPVLSLNHVFSPTVVSETRIGYQHQRIFRIPQNYNLGTNNIIPGLPFQPIDGAPQITITGIVSMSEAGSSDLQQDINFVENLSVVKGSHSFKMGFNYEFTTHYNIAAESPQRGAYAFNGQYSGNSVADFVLGYPTSTQLPTPAALIGKFVANRYNFYFLDDWKVTPKLTVNLGLRYELQVIRPEIHGDAALYIPGQNQIAVFANSYPSGAIPAAISAYPVTLSKNLGLPTNLMSYIGQDPNNFAPRVGLAYSLTPHTVFRSGFGVYYNVLTLNYTQAAQTNIPFLVVGTYEQPAGKIPGFTMSNPFPGSASVPANPNAQAYQHTSTPYNLQWNGTVEHQLKGGVGLRASYVGQRNVGQFGTPNINQPLPSPGPVQPNRPYQPFATISLNDDPIFQSTTHQLQGGVEKRYNNGLLVTAQYSFTRALGTETYMNPTNYNDSRGPLSALRKNVLVTSYVYDLPFGTGRPFLSHLSPAANYIIGGWQISGLVQALSGLPFSPSFDTTVQGSVGGRPNLILGVPLYPSNRSINNYFNPAAFAMPANYTYGNAGYDILWGPGQYTWDMGLSKRIKLIERAMLELRVDAFSVFNHPTFSNPASDISVTSTVGRITSAGGNRTVQIGAKLTF
jgi:Carboxypeptidase regulatory-like domain/TonB dependent receptor